MFNKLLKINYKKLVKHVVYVYFFYRKILLFNTFKTLCFNFFIYFFLSEYVLYTSVNREILIQINKII